MTEIETEVDAFVMNIVCRDVPQFYPTRLCLNFFVNQKHFREFPKVPMVRRLACLDSNPYVLLLFQKVGKGLQDISVFGEQSLTQKCLSLLPNITALRQYHHHFILSALVPSRYCCKYLVTLEFIGRQSYPEPIVAALFSCGQTALRALVIFNLGNRGGNSFEPLFYHAEDVAPLGMLQIGI